MRAAEVFHGQAAHAVITVRELQLFAAFAGVGPLVDLRCAAHRHGDEKNAQQGGKIVDAAVAEAKEYRRGELHLANKLLIFQRFPPPPKNSISRANVSQYGGRSQAVLDSEWH